LTMGSREFLYHLSRCATPGTNVETEEAGMCSNTATPGAAMGECTSQKSPIKSLNRIISYISPVKTGTAVILPPGRRAPRFRALSTAPGRASRDAGRFGPRAAVRGAFTLEAQWGAHTV
jgi:hypothetical protein